jgi:prephenate dehydratase
MKRIAFLGPEGTVSEEAARYFLKEDHFAFTPYKLISDVFTATVSGETALSVIPIENTIEGSVSLHLDWLVHEVDLPIQAEWTYPSLQNLIGRREEFLSEHESSDEIDYTKIKKILSHPVAIPQCREFIKQHLPHAQLEHVSSTAEGVRLVGENPGRQWAAIGTRLAAERYGLQLLKKHIQDHNNNYTRFILVGNEAPVLKQSESMKTSILVTLPEDYPGALHQVLSAFAWRRINLSRIESRPTRKKLGSYFFFIDIEGSLQSVLLPAAIAEIEAIGCQVRILGSYPTYSYETVNSEV